MTKCEGITGYKVDRDWIYVHTDGSPLSTLTLGNMPAPGVHLVESSLEIDFKSLTDEEIIFKTIGFRPGTVILGGLSPHAKGRIATNNDSPGKVTADADGRITLTVPARAEVELTIQ